MSDLKSMISKRVAIAIVFQLDLGVEKRGCTIASMAVSTRAPPIARRRVKGSIPYAKENRAAKTTSIVSITATLVVEIRA